MFNLETAIAEWRRRMIAGGIKTPVPLEELENHLREEIERQMRSGTNSERAFETAAQKIGPASALQSEFKKVDANRKERARALEQKLLIIFANLLPSMVCIPCIPVLFKLGDLSQMTSGQQLSCVAAAATFTLLFWSGRLGYRVFPVIRSKRTMAFIVVLFCVFLMLWFIVFFNLILPRYDFTFGQLIVAIFWGFIAPAGLLGFVFGIKTTARKKGAMAVS